MRIGFLGKGGSGKSTISSSYIQYVAQQGQHVLAIDADVNVHLQRALRLEGEPTAIGDLFSDISSYLRGSRTDIGEQPMVATTPPSVHSTFITPHANDSFVKKYALQEGNVSLLSVGTYTSDDVGHTCYHGKLNTLEMIYHHMLDNDEDIVVADATAGIDNLGTSLYFAYDINIFVVEPTQKSVGVFLNFYEEAKKLDLTVRVVVNKMEEGDEEFIAKHIPEELILGSVGRSRHIRRFEQGESEALTDFIAEYNNVFSSIHGFIESTKKDWPAYYERLITTHIQNSREWWNDYYGHPIDTQKDPNFSYEIVIQQRNNA